MTIIASEHTRVILRGRTIMLPDGLPCAEDRNKVKE